VLTSLNDATLYAGRKVCAVDRAAIDPAQRSRL